MLVKVYGDAPGSIFLGGTGVGGGGGGLGKEEATEQLTSGRLLIIYLYAKSQFIYIILYVF